MGLGMDMERDELLEDRAAFIAGKSKHGRGERLGAANFVGKESGDGGQRLASGDAVNHGDRGDAQMVVK
ncbi:hypothetical protein DOD04_27290 [Klebsiella michiganensis]|nr:hypothetical protein DOD04_27290 [Klebsiella michiganensis]